MVFTPLTPAALLPHLERAADDVAALLESGDLDAHVHPASRCLAVGTPPKLCSAPR